VHNPSYDFNDEILTWAPPFGRACRDQAIEGRAVTNTAGSAQTFGARHWLLRICPMRRCWRSRWAYRAHGFRGATTYYYWMAWRQLTA